MLLLLLLLLLLQMRGELSGHHDEKKSRKKPGSMIREDWKEQKRSVGVDSVLLIAVSII